MRKAFTLIELLISVSILSIMMIFLYKSYASLNMSNNFYKKELESIKSEQIKKRVFFLDFSLSLYKKNNILNQDIDEDVVFLQTSNSLHKRFNPYVAYIVKDSNLYRLESLKEFKVYPLDIDSEFEIDYIGEVDSFRVYKSTGKFEVVINNDTNATDSNTTENNTTIEQGPSELFLVHVDFKEDEDILLKIKGLNEQ